MSSPDGGSDSGWNGEFLAAVFEKRKKEIEISQLQRCRQMQECLDEGANINTKGINGNTALHKAVERGYHEVVNFLQQKRAATDITNDQGHTAITLAESLGDEEILRILKKPIQQQSGQATHRQSPAASTFPSLDNARSSTSRDQTRPSQDGQLKRTVTDQGDESLPCKKLKIYADQNCRGSPEKARWAVEDTPELGLHSDVAVDTDSGGSSISGDVDPEENAGETYAASGLKQALHGMVYQWKYLMLILHRAWMSGYSFRLATEMDKAEKFDDVVLEYQDSSGNKAHRFIQLKHKQDKADCEMITPNYLLDVNGGEFSMLKYFISWRRIKKHPDFSESKSKQFFLCTNIGLDVPRLTDRNINVEEVSESEKFLKTPVSPKRTARYYKLAKNPSQLYETLKLASDVHRLARELAERASGSKNLYLTSDVLKCYHAALAKEVIDKRSKKLYPNFLRNNSLSAKATRFREAFLFHMKKFKQQKETDILKSLEGIKFELAKTFGNELEFEINNFKTRAKKGSAARTELPDDDIEDNEISDFLDEFILAVDQPNEAELGDMIKYEIGAHSRFNLLNPELVGDSFQNAILDWFKTTGKHSVFLNKKNAKDLFNSLESLLSSIMSVGLNLPYPGELREYDIKFKRGIKDLQNFLDNSHRTPPPILQLISSEQTLLTALRVFQTIGVMEKYGKNDAFIFIRLEKLLLPEVKKRVLLAFASKRSHDLLVVDCETIGEKSDPYGYRRELWNKLCRIMKKHPCKRLIVIIEGNYDSAIEFDIDQITCHEKDDDIAIDNLMECSRKKVLKNTVVKFQRLELTSFGRLLDIQDFSAADRDADESADLRRIIDPKTLIKLIKKEEVIIGNEVKGLEDVEGYYIPRTIVSHVVIRRRILENPTVTENNLFAISGMDGETLERLVQKKDACKTSDGIDETGGQLNEYVILASGREKEHFISLCEASLGRNIHWLDGGSGKLIWKQSYRGISNLIEFEDERKDHDCDDRPGATKLMEDDLLGPEEQRRIVILSDVAGMGKSTVLTNLGGILKRNNPSMLVLRINLTEHAAVLDAERKNPRFDKERIDGAVDFLVEKLLKLETHVESETYKMIIKARGQAALLFDGFDEISPDYEDTVIELLQGLAKCPIEKLVVTTRPHTKKSLEKKLGTFSYNVQPFSPANQIDFLIKFWMKDLIGIHESDVKTKEALEEHAKQVVEFLAKSINDPMKEFTGVPLQTRLVAEVFPYGQEERLPETMTTVDLYRKFVDKKYEISCSEKKPGDKANLTEVMMTRYSREQFLMRHEKLALEALFDEDTVTALLNSQPDGERFAKDVERTGIITKVANGKPEFIHLTFAEYFAATFLTKILEGKTRRRELRKFFESQLFIKPQYKMIRAFINCLLSSESSPPSNQSWEFDSPSVCSSKRPTMSHVTYAERNVAIMIFVRNHIRKRRDVEYENIDAVTTLTEANSHVSQNTAALTLLHSAARRNDLDTIKELLAKGAGIESPDADGITPLHIAAKYGNFKVVNYLLKKGALVDSPSSRHGTPLHCAASEGNNLNVIQCLIENGAEINSRHGNSGTPLHLAARFDRLDAVKSLLKNGAEIDAQDVQGATPLHMASAFGYLNVVECLIQSKANIHSQTKRGATPLHKAACRGDLKLVKYLVENGADMNFDDTCGFKPLHWAAEAGSLEVVEYLLDKGVDINCQNKDCFTPLYQIARTAGNLMMVKYLHEKGADIHLPEKAGHVPLHRAASAVNNLEVVKYLHEIGADISTRCKTGCTPLHVAAEYGNLEVLKYLIEKGADVHVRTGKGRTPLHYAAKEAGKLEVVKYLHDKSADIHSQDDDTCTPLHVAAESGKLDVVRYLVENGAIVNFRDKAGHIPLHSAAINAGNLDVVKYLHGMGADICTRCKTGCTPLHVAAEYGNLEVVKYLIEKGADVHVRAEKGRTPLHCAVGEAGKLEVVKYLHDKSADIHSQDDDTCTPLHVAAESGKLDVVRYLVENGAIVDAQNKLGRTPLHLAAAFRNLEVVGNSTEEGANIHAQSRDNAAKLDVVKYLREKSANIHFQDKFGRTPLHAAASSGNLDVARYLVENGAIIDSQNNVGQTPLHAAVDEGNWDVVKSLLHSGANVNLQNHSGQTPQFLATSKYGDSVEVQNLFGNQFDVHSPDNGENSLLN